MTIYKLARTFTASADSGNSLDIQFDGIITGYWWNVDADLDADAEEYRVEASFLSSNTLGSNDARGSIAQVSQRASGTPGFVSHSVNSGISGLNIPVARGERIHLHGELTGTASVRVACYIYVDDRVNPRMTRRR